MLYFRHYRQCSAGIRVLRRFLLVFLAQASEQGHFPLYPYIPALRPADTKSMRTFPVHGMRPVPPELTGT